MIVREVRQDDDFSLIGTLLEKTVIRFHKEMGLHTQYSEDTAFLKRMLFANSEPRPSAKGFVAVQDDSIKAFICVNLSGKYKNGYVTAGMEEGYEACIPELVECCVNAVRENGGSAVHKFVALVPGQIRNSSITFWERYGFVSNPYYHAHIQLDVESWTMPGLLDTEGIAPAEDVELSDILRILIEDREDELAAVFQSGFQDKTPEHVILIMRSGQEREIAGISYYRVAAFRDIQPDGQGENGLGAWNVGFHFRSGVPLSRQEKGRFIRVAIASMKQLQIVSASSQVSSRDFDAFVELLAQGFQFQNPQSISPMTVRLTRSI